MCDHGECWVEDGGGWGCGHADGGEDHHRDEHEDGSGCVGQGWAAVVEAFGRARKVFLQSCQCSPQLLISACRQPPSGAD